MLEASGINLIVLGELDDYRAIAEKILAVLGVPGKYGFHKLWQPDSASVSLQMSGIIVNFKKPAGGSLLITDRVMSGIFREMAVENGYAVQ